MQKPDKIKDKKKSRLTSGQMMPLGFLLIILIGSLILNTPLALAPGVKMDFLTSLFTATTSVCITGLSVVDMSLHWSLFGKVVVLILIQIGGMGTVLVSSMILLALNKKISIKDRALLMDYFNLENIGGIIKFIRRVVRGIIIVEFIGALLYSFVFIPKYGLARGIWYSVFHSISAFCNAGIDILGPNSLIAYQDNFYLLSVTAFLIIMGGLGFVVWFDCLDTFKKSFKYKRGFRQYFHRLTEHTKLVLSVTGFLIVSGTMLVFFMEFSNPGTIGNMGIVKRLFNAFFESVTLRTAGFSSFSQENLRQATVLATCMYMFIGGSPMGTAGGVKTVTFFALFVNALGFAKGRNESVVFNRSFSEKMSRKATAVITVSLLISVTLTVLLMATEHVAMAPAMFEMFSATGTVGLSMAGTANFGIAGRIILIIAMYIGRVGPISMVVFFNAGTEEKNKISYAKGRFFIG